MSEELKKPYRKVSELEHIRTQLKLSALHKEVRALKDLLMKKERMLDEFETHKENITKIMTRIVGKPWHGHMTDAACVLERRLLIALKNDPTLAFSHQGKEFCARICPKLKDRLAEGIYSDPLWLCRECPVGYDDRLAPAIAEAEKRESCCGCGRILELE